ncbi:hypothetical protein ACIQUU_02995 [Streptomyces sp. NPDC101116]|uniref:hypothetical protein n=1 Tax=Streptomyces sp. NPDC101116 TaxID=3366107 RepID=UPI00382BE7DF
MTQGWKITVIVLAAIGVVSTPVIWLLHSPNAGELTGASIQATIGIGGFVWALLQSPANRLDDTAIRSGQARARRGGRAVTGIRRPQGQGNGSAKAATTGNATADGDGSSAVSGIDYS